MTYIIVRYPCLPEDEGRTHIVKTCESKEEAKEWIKGQEGKYFRPSDYGIMQPLEEG